MTHSPMPDGSSGCVLLFSGGRDSTIAAVRLGGMIRDLVLLTVTSAHLIGIERVKNRIVELRPHLPAETKWVHAVTKPRGLDLDRTEIESCLPCHSIYFLAAVHIANNHSAPQIATGYTNYQSSWLEQSPLALDRLRKVLRNVGKNLLLPAGEIASKEEAQFVLKSHGLSETALEQKCLKQQLNSTEVPTPLAIREIDNWARYLDNLLTCGNALDFLEITDSLRIDEVVA